MCVCVCVCAYLFVCMCMCVYVCVCACLCVCGLPDVWSRLRLPQKIAREGGIEEGGEGQRKREVKEGGRKGGKTECGREEFF